MKTKINGFIGLGILLALFLIGAKETEVKKKSKMQPSGQVLKILTFNICEGGKSIIGIDFGSPLCGRLRHADIAGVILESGADIVGVNEPPSNPDLLLPLLQARDPKWQVRGGSDGRIGINLYSRFPIEPDPLHPNDPTIHLVRISPTLSVIVFTIHWWPVHGDGCFYIQKRIMDGDIPSDRKVFEKQVLEATSIPDTYQKTLARVQPHLDAGRPVFIIGDFNEASHLDWTNKYAKSGRDRWVNNTSGIPLRHKIAWAGSKILIDAGMKDAYREVFTDPVAKPGNTWTPPYANGTPGRRPYDEAGKASQVLERIDWILFAGRGVKVLDAAVVGEDPSHPEHGGKSELVPEIRYSGPWPSDHRAVLGVFSLTSEAGTEKHE